MKTLTCRNKKRAGWKPARTKLTLRKLASSALLLATLISQPSTSFAQGTGFSYQGRLNTNGAPATGSYDLRFSLWNAASGPSQLGGTLTIAATAVSNGLFTVTLDFGAGMFTGDPRWLEIEVATHGGTFAAISPRQALLPTPYAIHASTATAVVAGSVVKSLNALKDDVTLAAGSNVTITPSGNTLIIAGSGGWKLGGNAGTTPGVNFLGTADNQALQLKVNNAIALQFTPGVTVPNVVGGLASIKPTVIGSGVSGAVVAGGNAPSGGVDGFGGGDFQAVYDNDGTIGGGFGNQVGSNDGDPTDAAFATVAGGVFNYATAYGASVGGGDSNVADGQRAAVLGGYANQARGAASAVGGGFGNQAWSDNSVVAGGVNNHLAAYSPNSTIGGGNANSIDIASAGSTISGGVSNVIVSGFEAVNYGNTIGGGVNNTIGPGGHYYSVIPGGYGNTVGESFALAAGQNAHANHKGSFVWADASTTAFFASTANNQFSIRAAGGVRLNTDTSLVFGDAGSSQLWPDQGGAIELGNSLGNGNTPYIDFHYGIGIAQDYNVRLINDAPGFLTCSGVFEAQVLVQTSDRNAKQNFKPVKPREVLEKVSALPITEWDFKQGPGTRHLGPMAQDFRAAFGLGTDDKHIATVDEGGVALAAIQGLNQKVEDLNAELQRRDTENAALKQRLDRLERLINHENGGAQ